MVVLSLAAALAQAESLTLCNQSDTQMGFAYWIEQGSNPFSPECQLTRRNCAVEGRGWFLMDPGACEQVGVGDGWRAWFSVYQRAKPSGAWRLLSLRPSEMPSIEESGSTGISNAYLCGMPDTSFARTFQGTVEEAAQERCPSGLGRVPINMLAQTGRATQFRVNLTN